MINPNYKLVTNSTQLPNVAGCEHLFLDVETCIMSDVKKWAGLYPFKGDRIAGIALKTSDSPTCWYVPVRHKNYNNVDFSAYQKWLTEIMSKRDGWWINHNILIDMAFVAHDGVPIHRQVIDTLTTVKLLDTDRMKYGLKPYCKEVLGLPMAEELGIKAALKIIKSKSYGDVHPNIMGEYACNDVFANEILHQHIESTLPEQVRGVYKTEILLTPILHDMELVGQQVVKQELILDKLAGIRLLIELSSKLAELTNREFTNSSICIRDIFCNILGLPVLLTITKRDSLTGRYIDTGRPCFDKKALALYEVHPQVTGNKTNNKIVQMIMAYRKESQHQSLFVNSFLELMDSSERIHTTYTQLVRTGRMSAKRPNGQQNTKRSKRLIKPRKGRCFISCDYSQIEFRLIVHYIRDQDAIMAYHENPKTDFHEWVANMCHMDRSAGKTMNFRIGFGAGKFNVEAALATDKSVAAEVSKEVEKMGIADDQKNRMFHQLCKDRAAALYHKYHETLPGIKKTSAEAEAVCKRRGFVFNNHGRRRHLPPKAARKAFNNLCQGDAMDIIKERMVAISHLYNKKMRDWDIRIAANVHDEILFDAPEELMLNTEVHDYILSVLQTPDVKYSVPIIAGLGVSKNNWGEASGDLSVLEDGSKVKTVPDGAKILAGKLR